MLVIPARHSSRPQPCAGECPAGVPLGTAGCTWRRKPLAHIIWLADLLAAGFDHSPTELNFTQARYDHNAGVINRTMKELWSKFTFAGGSPCAEVFP